MKLVVGLGNPGRKYQGTRHNIGFIVLAHLAGKYGGGKPKAKFQGEVVDADLNGERAVLLCPHTFMNNSGNSVQPARDFYKLENHEVIVICDDFNLPLGTIRFRPSGSSGGQKGLADIVRRLGDELVPRLRIGIGPLPDGWESVDFVLGRFNDKEAKEVEEIAERAAQGIVDWAHQGIDYSMNQYN